MKSLNLKLISIQLCFDIQSHKGFQETGTAHSLRIASNLFCFVCFTTGHGCGCSKKWWFPEIGNSHSPQKHKITFVTIASQPSIVKCIACIWVLISSHLRACFSQATYFGKSRIISDNFFSECLPWTGYMFPSFLISSGFKHKQAKAN